MRAVRPVPASASAAAAALALVLAASAGCGGGGGGGEGGAASGTDVAPFEQGTYLNLALPSVIAKGESTTVRLRVVTQAGLPDYDFEGGFRLDSRFPGVTFPPGARWAPHELGFYRMEGTVFDATGVHFLRGVVPGDTVQALANPVVVQEDPAYRIWWGDLSGHSDLSDGQRGPGVYFWYARAVALLDFAALTDNDALADGSKSLDAQGWQDIRDLAAENEEDGAFVAFPGFTWTSAEYGDRIVLFDVPPDALPTVASGVDTPAKLRAAVGNGGLIIAAHPSGSASDPSADPAGIGGEDLVEIYSGLGSFEEADAIRATTRETPGAFVRDLLAHHPDWRPGFVASTDTRVSLPGNPRPFVVGDHRWPGGLTAVLARELTPGAILEALRAGRCYATTGPRFLLEFTVDGQPMGSTVRVKKGSTAAIYGSVATTGKWLRLEFLGPDGVVAEMSPPPDDADVIELEATTPPIVAPTWIYLRALDENGAMAWSTPVWLRPE